jgi:hypothetical protein
MRCKLGFEEGDYLEVEVVENGVWLRPVPRTELSNRRETQRPERLERSSNGRKREPTSEPTRPRRPMPISGGRVVLIILGIVLSLLILSALHEPAYEQVKQGSGCSSQGGLWPC